MAIKSLLMLWFQASQFITNPTSEKKELYAEVFHLLAEGGVFLNLEHVASATPNVECLFDNYFIPNPQK